jgi:hypothetical protein
MAYTLNEDDKQSLDENGQPIQTSAPQSSTIEGQGAAPTAASNTPNTMASGPTPTPGNFVGIQQYINANKPQSAGLANKVGGYVENLGNEARSQLESGKSQFNQAVEQGTTKLNEGLANEAATNATSVFNDPNKKAEFQKERDASYTGPTSFAGSTFYTPAEQAVNKATTAASNATTAQGQSSILAQQAKEKSGRVNQGVNTFDTALLQSDPNAKNRLQGAAAQQSGLSESLNQVQNQSLSAAEQAKKTAAATKQAIADKILGKTGAVQGIQGAVAQRADTATAKEAEIAKTQKALSDALKSGSITRDQAVQLGMMSDNSINKPGAINTYGLTPADYFQYNQQLPATAAGVMTPEEKAQLDALYGLMGQENTFVPKDAETGTYKESTFGLKPDYKTSLDTAKQNYETALAKPQSLPWFSASPVSVNQVEDWANKMYPYSAASNAKYANNPNHPYNMVWNWINGQKAGLGGNTTFNVTPSVPQGTK